MVRLCLFIHIRINLNIYPKTSLYDNWQLVLLIWYIYKSIKKNAYILKGVLKIAQKINCTYNRWHWLKLGPAIYMAALNHFWTTYSNKKLNNKKKNSLRMQLNKFTYIKNCYFRIKILESDSSFYFQGRFNLNYIVWMKFQVENFYII